MRRALVGLFVLSFVLDACTSTSSDRPSSETGLDAGEDAAPIGASDAGAAADDAATAPDARPPPRPGCGDFADASAFTCSKDGNSRGKCVDDETNVEACPRGCLREPAPTDSVCMGDASTWECPGSYGTKRAENGDYYISSFGCWVDQAGKEHTDPGDNCIPSCLQKAKAAGLCDPNDTGKACEERVNWFTADAARFGCLQRLRVTNPANGKSLIAVALDFGPACSGEAKVSHAVLDSSGRLDEYLFGTQHGGVDRALVHVVEVDETTPLGPLP